MTVVELYASGPGLMRYSPAVERRLHDGRNYMPARGGLEPPLRELVEEEQLPCSGPAHPVQIGSTGAPEVRAASRVRFGLVIEGGALCIRDGYDPMEWHFESESLRRIPIPDGYYAVDALWVPAACDSMRIHLLFQKTDERVDGEGWPFLEYRVGEG